MSLFASLRTVLGAMALAILAGCASGPKFAETSSSMAAVMPGDGRIFFYRSGSVVGAAVQPDVRLNGEVVGTSKPGGFFYVDRPAGSYIAAASTETEKSVNFDLDAGETKYLKMSVQMGFIVGRVGFTVEAPEAAEAELRSLSYVGTAPKAEPGRAVAAAVAAPKPAPPPAAAASAPTSVAARAGVRLTFVESDSISRAPTGETTLTLVQTTATERIYNDGAVVTALDGTPIKGSPHGTIIYGAGPREIARGGNWNGMVRAAGIADDVPVTFTVLRKEAKTVSGYRFEATRIRIEGYATRSLTNGGRPDNCAYLSGEALIDNATGLVLELELACRHPAYPVHRELVRVGGLS